MKFENISGAGRAESPKLPRVQEVIVLGGYGRLGEQCVSELVDTTRARIVVAGRNIQRAERVASRFGHRARPAYANAEDPRTLQTLIPGAAAVLICSGGSWLAVLDSAIQTRVPFISLSPSLLEERVSLRLQQEAWRSQVPVILQAGAIPGLPGVLAELLMRRFPSLHEIRIASTGPWSETELAKADQRELRRAGKLASNGRAALSERWRRSRWHFPEPIGARWVRPARSLDLDGFAEAHCVDHLVYLEPDQGLLVRGVQQVLQRNHELEFALVAEGYDAERKGSPQERLTLQSSDLLSVAAAAAGALTQRVLAGALPAGVLAQREALNPALLLEALTKRDVRVVSSAGSL